MVAAAEGEPPNFENAGAELVAMSSVVVNVSPPEMHTKYVATTI